MSHSSAGLEASTLQQNGQDSGQSRKSKAISGASKSSPLDSPASSASPISAPSRAAQGLAQLPLFPEGSPASLSVAPGSDAARTITAISGRKWRGSYEPSSPLGLLLRILLERSNWSSIARLLIWRRRVTPGRRWYYRLSPWRPGTKDSGFSSWPTLTASDGRPKGTGGNRDSSTSPVRHSLFARARIGNWPNPLPTLRAGDSKGGAYQRDHGQKGKERPTLCGLLPTLTRSMATPADMELARYSGTDPKRPTYQEAKLLSTLLNRDQRSYAGAQQSPRAHGGTNLVRVSGGKLNADWCEWYMGFPVGWTDIAGEELRPSETRASRRKSTRSYKR